MLCILLYNCFDVVFPDVQVLKFVIARRYYAEINVLRYSSTRDPFPFCSMRKFSLANIVTYPSSLFCHCRSSWPLLGIGKKCQTTSEKKVEKREKKQKKKSKKKNYYRSRFECPLSNLYLTCLGLTIYKLFFFGILPRLKMI